jgi:uncharacterized repeat protein (TIGR03803 family)
MEVKHMRYPSLASIIAHSALVLPFAYAGQAVAQTEQVLHDFVILPFGANPSSGVIEDSAGNLYGTANEGGTYNNGVVFELTPGAKGSGWSQKILHTFSDLEELTSLPGVTLDGGGNLYGTIPNGGAYGCGAVYKLSPTAGGEWTYEIIHSFCASSTDASEPMGSLTFDQKGNLYGTSYAGGTYKQGSVFQLSPSTNGDWVERILYSFGSKQVGGTLPEFEVTIDASGNIFGTTTAGGNENCNYENRPAGCGVVFELTEAGGLWNENILYTFGTNHEEDDYVGPAAGLVLDSAGNLYGSVPYALYELEPTAEGPWSFTTLPSPEGFVSGTLALDKAGSLYGETVDGGNGNGSAFELQNTAGGWMLETIYSFPSSDLNLYPSGGLMVDSRGDLFGVAYRSSNEDYNGTVFELIPSATDTWTEEAIYLFPQRDGDYPNGDLIADSVGNLYGVAKDSGENTNCLPSYYCGVAFRLSPLQGGTWQYDILYDFSLSASVVGAGGGPAGPTSGLVFDSSGNLYGTTQEGGPYGSWGDGAVFKLSPTASGPWQETTLYEFGGVPNDGILPVSKLLFDSAGNLYGTTTTGGRRPIDCNCYGGTIFELSPQTDGTWRETQLYTFKGGIEGSEPLAGLVWDQSGNLYGTTAEGGGSPNCEYGAGCGTVFKLAPNGNGTWTETTIYTFSGFDGQYPRASLIFDSAGNLYGTASGGGSKGNGVVFRLVQNGSGWTETTLYNFKGSTDGAEPLSDLTFDSDGNLYGTTFSGARTNCDYFGTIGCGTVFRLTPNASGEWTESIVHYFGSSADGANPYSGVYIDGSNNLFTMTISGPGVATGGTVVEVKQ